MTLYCRDDPVSSRWAGVNRLLTEYEIDYNFYGHETRIQTLEDNFTTTISIASISQPSSSTMLITLTDSSTQGPFDLPVSTFQDRGAWLPSTPYLANDTFTANGSLYRVIFAHTSGLTFSPTANDGAGHDYYAAMMSSPGNALPAGGATAMMLKKSTGADYAVSWGYPLPTGGTQYQVLMKDSSTTQDASWTTLNALRVDFTPSTGSALTSTNVADALEELEAAIGEGGGGASALSDLTDVLFATGQPAANDLLIFDGVKWGSAPLSYAGALSTSQLRNLAITALGTGSTAVMDLTLGDVFTLTPVTDMTLSAVYIPPGCEITLIVTTSGTGGWTLTFGTHIKSQGTLATGVVSGKTFAVKFVGDGTNLVEVSRTTAM